VVLLVLVAAFAAAVEILLVYDSIGHAPGPLTSTASWASILFMWLVGFAGNVNCRFWAELF
jgi:hypothetical protein